MEIHGGVISFYFGVDKLHKICYFMFRSFVKYAQKGDNDEKG